MHQYTGDNTQALDKLGIPIKVNNDVLIPRSILKKNEVDRKDLYDKELPDDLGEYDDLIG